ncbi:RagB/SusD family nutrient uptake outer membrane protein [Chitinophaga varians]|uniref:RagB/SusD family nutrient uptake outer membrane protein n=1 Tax=Chitinophaga varians TaxID=2202339 RepID=UPI00165FB129|nr:RagB/SusD family nutrient uptake outer membrane protein [Chitinophaga varians]MBC9913904.1 RagB/SusD family nutrient uptake outer membrane protein [Chitinophaga varians]
MKIKRLAYLALVSTSFLTTSCNKDFLNQVPDDRITIEQVFARRRYSEEYLANIYSTIPNEAYRNTSPWEGCSDDADITYDRPGSGYDTYPINLGNWSAASGYMDTWSKYYRGIRSASYFMQHIDENKEIKELPNGQDLIDKYKAEARFLRAFFYYGLLRQYGPVILLGDTPIAGDLEPSDAEMQKPRNSYDECVNYIVTELDLAATKLPKHFTEQADADYGRATAATCKAIKSRVLLLAASPQFNGNTDYAGFSNIDGKQLISSTFDKEKWKRAADAAKDVITGFNFSLYRKNDAAGKYDPYLSCRDVLLDPWNSEVIFARTTNNLKDWERSTSPRLANGYAAVAVTQQLVDEFEMQNGKGIREAASGYVETGFSTAATKYTTAGTYNMYVNREPRFYVNVSYNGSLWINTSEGNKVIETFFTGNTGKKGSWDFPRTGYIARKNIHPNSNPRISQYIARPFVLVRYAEILLNYIEALNEYAPGDPDIAKYLNEIRNRAGLPEVTPGLGQSEMRSKIRHERRVELALESLRYFDTRRWKIAEQTDGGNFYGMNVDAGTKLTDLVFYQRTVFERRIFLKNYYLFPIPQSEMDRDRNLVQNPGW